jgi:hypothetical protein
MAKFATAINCMDGRVQQPVIDFIQKTFSVDYVDMITLPGPNKILAEGKEKALIELIRNCLEISLFRHQSELVAIAGHYDCAGNPGDEATQLQDILRAMEVVASWFSNVKIIGLWIDASWKVKLIASC